MSASEEVSVNSIQTLGILAGGGDLPRRLIDHCKNNGLEVFVVAFKGQTAPETLDGVDHIEMPLGSAGKIIKALKGRSVKDLVLIGRIRRPSLKDLKPDLKTAEFFLNEGRKAVGDDGLLRGLKRFLSKEGFDIHGVQAFMPDLLAPEGVLTKTTPSKEQLRDIERGQAVLDALGPVDVGQAVVVQEGHILGIEAAEGTDELIKRCATLKREGASPVLVKLSKAGQDQDLDLPTIGPQTLKNVKDAGFCGIAVHAGRSLIYNVDEVCDFADENGLFIQGLL